MKNSTLSLVLAGVVGLLLVQLAAAQNPAEMAVRMKVQQLLNIFPSMYQDIRQGRLVPSSLGGQYAPQAYLPGQQQSGFIQPGQFVPAQAGQFLPAQQGQVVVPMNTGR